MSQAKIKARIAVLEAKQNCLTIKCPLRIKVSVATELDALRSQLVK